MNKCATLRRDFKIQGFAQYQNDTKTAADKWQEEYTRFTAGLTDLGNMPGFTANNRQLVDGALKNAQTYKQVFGDQVKARKSKDDAISTWAKMGWNITSDIETIKKEVIRPSIAKVKTEKDLAGIIKWSGIEAQLDGDFIQPFLLLRVKANFLLVKNTEEQWLGYQKQLQEVKDGIGRWSVLVKGDSKLEQTVQNITGYLKEYEGAGEIYHAGIVADKATDTQMAQTAGEITKTMGELDESLRHDMEAITARTNTLMMILALGSIILGTILAWVITRSIVKPVNRIIADLTAGAEQVAAAAGQISNSSQASAQGASEQASSLEETSSALEEMTSVSRINAENAGKGNELMTQTTQEVDQARAVMQQATDAMGSINDASSKIAKIIKVIEGIAFQTNLLALNAAGGSRPGRGTGKGICRRGR